ncbi:Pectinesterase [Mycena venus]|uniref:Pectinesterase n=1 Tax=Mycena venus TaxID=2733690 RepID=A0A8H6YUV7_9AGAR|nr:Pectinesterase [Mycena venus]
MEEAEYHAFNASPFELEKRASRTTPPSGSVITLHLEFQSALQAAVNSLPNDSSARTIFIYPGMNCELDILQPHFTPGTYQEQVLITRPGMLTIYGSTTDTTSYTSNSVTITFSDSAAEAGSDDPSGTLRVKKDGYDTVSYKQTLQQYKLVPGLL